MLARISASARRVNALERRRDDSLAIVVEQRRQPPLAEIERVQLTDEVAVVGLRNPAVRREDRDDVLVDLAARDQLDRRNAHALLEAFGRARVEAAGHVAADVEPMADRGEPAEQLALAKHRPHQPEVVEMRAAVVGIVEQEGVAGLEPALARDLVDHRLHREGHGADEDRQAGRSLHQRRAGFGDGRGRDRRRAPRR